MSSVIANSKAPGEAAGHKFLSMLQTANEILQYCGIFLLLGALVLGYVNRDDGYLSAANGIGYWLGIAGGCMMMLLLTYSIRKRNKHLRRVFKLRHWFQLHMTLGVLGPFCILLHSNFHLGSFNSTVALVCMLIVAGSGFIGRFFYTNIHYGLYGEKIRLGQVIKDFGVVKNEILALCVSDKQKSAVDKLFEQINSVAQKQSQGISLWSLGSERRKVRKLSRTLKNIVQQLENQHKTTDTSTASVRKVKSALHRDIPRLLSVLRRLPGLQLFERLFALWHVLHIPFFILMVLTAITHIVVVHMY